MLQNLFWHISQHSYDAIQVKKQDYNFLRMCINKIEITYKEKLILESKDSLSKCEIAYQTYGKLNKKKK